MKNKLAVLTCFFNPIKSKNRLENYYTFKENLSDNCELFTIELSFDGCRQLYGGNVVYINGNRDNLLWQKERLLNVLLKHVPSSFDKIAWLDCDIVFENAKWAKQTMFKLSSSKYVIGQVFDTVEFLDPDGGVVWKRKSFCSSLLDGKFDLYCTNTNTGIGWACNRWLLEHNPLLDVFIMDDADSMMALANLGVIKPVIIREFPKILQDETIEYTIKQGKYVDNRFFSIDGNVKHLYHGSYENRQYASRRSILKSHNFCHKTDIQLDENGIWKWSGNKPQLQSDVERYFHSRNDDDVLNFGSHLVSLIAPEKVCNVVNFDILNSEYGFELFDGSYDHKSLLCNHIPKNTDIQSFKNISNIAFVCHPEMYLGYLGGSENDYLLAISRISPNMNVYHFEDYIHNPEYILNDIKIRNSSITSYPFDIQTMNEDQRIFFKQQIDNKNEKWFDDMFSIHKFKHIKTKVTSECLDAYKKILDKYPRLVIPLFK